MHTFSLSTHAPRHTQLPQTQGIHYKPTKDQTNTHPKTHEQGSHNTHYTQKLPFKNTQESVNSTQLPLNVNTFVHVEFLFVGFKDIISQ
jgi:hypothetical protein